MSNKQQPKKHHFVPKFYQRGFCDETDILYVYNKKYKNINHRNPSQILYDIHLHTIRFDNNQTTMIEEFYSQIEGEFSNYILLLNDGIELFIKDMEDDENFIKVIKIIVAIQFWRTPCNKERASQFSKELLGLYDKANNEIKELLGFNRKLIKYFSKRYDDSNTLKVIQFLLLPLLTFDLSGNKENIRFYRNSQSSTFFTSDKPVIFNEDRIEDLFSFKEVLFPLSKELLLFAHKENGQRISVSAVNKLIAHNANNLVISYSKNQLEEYKSNEQLDDGRGEQPATPIIRLPAAPVTRDVMLLK